MKQISIYIAIAIASAGITKYFFPTVQEKVKIEEKETVRTDVRTVIRHVKLPDGTEKTETEIIDKSKLNSSKQYEKLVSKEPQWLLGVGASTALKNLEPIYDVSVSRRVLGPFFLGAAVRTNKEVGVRLGMEF